MENFGNRGGYQHKAATSLQPALLGISLLAWATREALR
jgi:hypothetical protein